MSTIFIKEVLFVCIDGHIHMWEVSGDSEKLINNMKKCCIDGGIVFSCPAGSFETKYSGIPWKKKIEEVIRFTEGKEGLIPFYFLDPQEDDVYDQINYAIEKKVRGFKVICTHFYPQDDKMMKI